MTRLHVALTLLTFLLLVPGVTLPDYSVSIMTRLEASIIGKPIEVTVYEQTRLWVPSSTAL